jgi:pyruvate,water dikinase
MRPFVLPLSDPGATLEIAGGKGVSLTKMIAAGLPVPDGFHVTTEAYRCFVAENGIQSRIMEVLSGVDPTDTAALEGVSSRIGGFFAVGKTPPEITEAITTAYAGLQNAPVAVRSSATAEDLPGASFAGQQETYLNIRGIEAVLSSVKKCWASLWTARAIAYRLKNEIDQDTVALAVVVQEMVFADAAGILFTANPVNGKRDELVINAAWGLGEAIVSGAVTPDTLTVIKDTGRIVHREIAEKSVMTVRTETGAHEQPVPEDLKKKPVLTSAQAAELARLGVKIEQFYEMPMDVEWALARGEFAIVQARPITALPPEWKAPDPKAIFARGSLAEHTPSPVTPLFATLGLEIANKATARLWDRVAGKGSKALMTGGGFYQLINGYVYGGIRMSPKELIKIIRMSVSQLGPFFRDSVARWQAARIELAAVVDAWEQKPVQSLTPSGLMEGVRTVFGAACRYFTDIQTTLPAASTSEILFTRFYNSLIKREQDPPATVFLLGFDTYALQAEKSLFDISTWLQETPELAEYLPQTPTGRLLEDFKQEAAPAGLPAGLWDGWQQRFQGHLQEFGRTAYEFDFASPTPMETPGPMLEAIKGFMSGAVQNPYERQREAVEKREQATQAVLQRVGLLRKGLFLKLLRWAQDTAPMRENGIYDMGMGHPLVRRMFAELSRRFMAGGAIQQEEDIYWLEKQEVEELVSALEEGSPLPDFSGRIPERKTRWQSYLKISPPVMLPEKSGWSKLMHGQEAEKRDGKLVLKGVGTSSGTITAPACVLFGPEDFPKMKAGDVLVAVTTTPAWTPLFAKASAVVTDIGGPLSHSSIVAREYGIPAVMAARGATRSIQDGQVVIVDGNAGTVTLE